MESTTSLTLGIKELYHDLDFQDAYPAGRFLDYLDEVFSQSSSTIQRLDFSGIEQVTDEVVHLLVSVAMRHDTESHLQHISFAACTHLTDYGVYRLAKCFKDLRKVTLDGCINITERGLHYLMTECQKLEDVSLKGTNVGYVPITRAEVKLSLDGCPVYNDLRNAENTVNRKQSVQPKTVVMCDVGVKLDVAAYLKGPNIGEFIKGDENQGGSMKFHPDNMVYEFHGNEFGPSAFITDGAVYIYAFDVDDNLGNPQVEIMSRLDSLHAQVLSAPFIILAFHAPSEEANEAIVRLTKTLTTAITSRTEYAQNFIKKHDSRDRDFQFQQHYSRGLQAKELHAADPIYFFSIEKETKKVENYLLRQDSANPGSDIMMEEATKTQEQWTGKAYAALDSLRKSDISELLSMTKPPEKVKSVAVGMLVVMGKVKTLKQGTWQDFKKVARNMSFLTDLREALANPREYADKCRQVTSLMENPDNTEEKLRGVSVAAGSFFLWIQAIYKYNTEYWPIASVKELAQKEKMEMQNRKDHTAIHFSLSACEKHLEMMYQWEPYQFVKAADDLFTTLPKVKVMKLEDYVGGLEVKPFGDSLGPYRKALQRLMNMGNILFYPNVLGEPIIFDVQWFMNIMVLKHKDDALQNHNRVLSLTRYTQLYKRDNLEVAYRDQCSVDEFSAVLPILQHYAVLIEVESTMTSCSEPDWYYVFFKDVPPKMYLWANPRKDQLSGPGERAYNMDNPDDREGIVSNYHHVKHFWPDQKLDTDLEVKYSYNLNHGFPSELLPQLIAKLYDMFEVKFCCQTCIVIGRGAVEAKVKYNIHGTRITASLDVEARCTKFMVEQEANEYIIHQYMWSLVNNICLCVESLIISYPLLHTHVVIPCVGSCAKTVYRHFFSPLDLVNDINGTISCPNCKEEQMSRLSYGLLNGRHSILPFHDWKDELGTKRCHHCGVTETQSEKFWAMESSIYPTFTTQTFMFIEAAMRLEEESISPVTSEGKPTELYLSAQPLSVEDFKKVRFLVLDSSGLELHLIQDIECIKRLKQGNTDEFDSKLVRPAEVTLSLTSGLLTKTVTGEEKKEGHEALKLSLGELLELDVKYGITDDGWETNNLMLTISKNGSPFVSLDLKKECYVAVMSHGSFKTETGPKLVIKTPSCPVVTARHFNTNTSVVYKTGIGMQWAVGIIQSIKDGYLYVSQDKSDPSSAQKINPSSEDLVPLCVTPGDMNILVGREPLKRSKQVYQFLNETKTVPAPMGLFRRSAVGKESDFQSLPMKGRLEKHPVQCTTGIYAPQVLGRTMENSIMAKNRLPPVPMLFLPSTLEAHYLYHPSRQVVHDLGNQGVTQVCTGDIVSRRNAIHHASHFMNAPVLPLANVDGVSSSDTGLIWRALASPFLEGYHRLVEYPPLLKMWNKIFPEIAEDFDQGLMRRCLSGLMSLYYETLLLLLAVNTDIEMNPESRQDEAESYTIKINKAFKSRDDLKDGQCGSHRAVDWKLVDDAENIRAIKLPPDAKLNTAMEMIQRFTNLVTVDVSRCRFKTLDGIGCCSSLEILDLSENDLQELPADLENLKGTLKSLNVNTNPLKSLPNFICEFKKLEILYAGNTLLRNLPEDFGSLRRLHWLALENNCIVNLPESFRKLKSLTYLNLRGVMWITATDMPHRSMTLDKYMSHVTDRKWSYNMVLLEKKEKEELYYACDPTDAGFSSKGTYEMQERMFKLFPRMGVDNQDSTDIAIFGGIPQEIFSCRNLTYLQLSHQGLKVIPDMIGELKNLKELHISDNPYLTSVSGEVTMTAIEGLNLLNCPSLKTPPQEIIKQNDQKLNIAFLRRLAAGSVTCYRTKLMLVGLGEAGKTSLIRALMNDAFKAQDTVAEGITDGIDIQNWQVTQRNQTLTYSVWDFAGQTVYYNTHQFFLSKRAIYILVWNMRLGFEHAGLDFWLSSIQCHAPETPVFIVGTHADQVSRSELPSDKLCRKFPNISGFFYISSVTGQGVSDFFEKLIETTFEQPYMGERIPEVWFNFEKNIISRRHSGSLLLWEDIEKEAARSAVFGTEIKQAVQFLHDLGSLQHFDNDFLRNRVVINPQWIVDVMACVVSVHNDVNKHGYLDHKDIAIIWKEYETELHDWLLRLTELFDLTFPLSDQDVNVVPCLLPQTEPEIQWPTMKEGIRKGEMLYRFESLPAGLFNRAQVRLYQFSDGSSMWKRGSVLKKNDHMAVISLEGESEVLVKAQGTRPENMILLVHEVFEGLILEFFRGVHYEYLMPCPDCLKAEAKHPTMFPSSVLRRAVELKAMHLQCHAYFHSLSISEVQALMPPEASEDYEVHMNNMVHDMEDLKSQLPFDTCILYCKADVPEKEADAVHPRKVKEDLEKKGFTVWYQDNLHNVPVDDVMKALSMSKTVITFVSETFVLDADCQRMFQFAQQSLRKPILLVVTGKGRKWQQSTIGMKTSHQVYVNMQRVKQYEAKLQELVSQVTGKVGKKKVVKGADVFLSYCWTNSPKAVEIGHAIEKAGSLGHGDPRQLKEYLESEGFSAWIDFENVGVNGLFSDIGESLKKCKLVVACVSDEYAMSPNCQMEFRFAHVTLKKPIILAVVGTGYRWESTEVGLLALGYPKMNFQVANNIAFTQLKEAVADALAGLDSPDDSKTIQGTQKQSAFQELYELAQRKFLRQLAAYTENSSDYPRIFVLDLQDSKNDQETGDTAVNAIDIDVNEKDGDEKHYGTGEYCFRVLCEHEGGWHSVDEGLPVQMIQDEVKPLLELTAPFFARILSILKHSNINLQCLNSSRGGAFMEFLEQHAGVNIDIRPFYQTIRQHIIQKDVKKTFGGLARCYLPSGKFLWLCPEHQKLPRVSKLDIIMSDSSHQEVPNDYKLIEDLKIYQDLVIVKTQGNKNIPREPKETPSEAPVQSDTKLSTVKEEVRMPAPQPVAPVKPAAGKSTNSKTDTSSSNQKPADQKPAKKLNRSQSAACTVQ